MSTCARVRRCSGRRDAPWRDVACAPPLPCAHARIYEGGPDSMARCCPDPVAHACCGEATHAHMGAEDPAHRRAGDKAISRDCAPALWARRYSGRQALMTAGVHSARIPSAGTPGAANENLERLAAGRRSSRAKRGPLAHLVGAARAHMRAYTTRAGLHGTMLPGSCRTCVLW
jgi:hypothetical protein